MKLIELSNPKLATQIGQTQKWMSEMSSIMSTGKTVRAPKGLIKDREAFHKWMKEQEV